MGREALRPLQWSARFGKSANTAQTEGQDAATCRRTVRWRSAMMIAPRGCRLVPYCEGRNVACPGFSGVRLARGAPPPGWCTFRRPKVANFSAPLDKAEPAHT